MVHNPLYMSEYSTIDPELEEMIRENNELLHKIHGSQVRSRIYKFVYVAIIVVLAVMSYLAIRPYLEQVRSLYGQVQSNAETVQGVGEQLQQSDIEGILDLLR